jgi:hypothetical protein
MFQKKVKIKSKENMPIYEGRLQTTIPQANRESMRIISPWEVFREYRDGNTLNRVQFGCLKREPTGTITSGTYAVINGEEYIVPDSKRIMQINEESKIKDGFLVTPNPNKDYYNYTHLDIIPERREKMFQNIKYEFEALENELLEELCINRDNIEKIHDTIMERFGYTTNISFDFNNYFSEEIKKLSQDNFLEMPIQITPPYKKDSPFLISTRSLDPKYESGIQFIGMPNRKNY